MIKIEHSVLINRPTEEVFTFVTEVENEPKWIGEVAEVRRTSNGPMGVGSTYDNIVHFLGRRIVDPHEVVQYEPNRKFAFKSNSGQIKFQGSQTYEAVDDNTTRFTFVASGETGSLFKLAEPIVSRMINRQWETNVANLKELLEAQS